MDEARACRGKAISGGVKAASCAPHWAFTASSLCRFRVTSIRVDSGGFVKAKWGQVDDSVVRLRLVRTNHYVRAHTDSKSRQSQGKRLLGESSLVTGICEAYQRTISPRVPYVVCDSTIPAIRT